MAGAEGFENEPLMLKDLLKLLISSVPHDLGGPEGLKRDGFLSAAVFELNRCDFVLARLRQVYVDGWLTLRITSPDPCLFVGEG